MSNLILFRSCNSLRTAELTDAARLRMLSLRQLPWQPSKAAFIQGGGWYTGGPVSKVDLVQSYLIHTGPGLTGTTSTSWRSLKTPPRFTA